MANEKIASHTQLALADPQIIPTEAMEILMEVVEKYLPNKVGNQRASKFILHVAPYECGCCFPQVSAIVRLTLGIIGYSIEQEAAGLYLLHIDWTAGDGNVHNPCPMWLCIKNLGGFWCKGEIKVVVDRAIPEYKRWRGHWHWVP